MIKIIHILTTSNFFSHSKKPSNRPVRLDKKEKKTSFETLCRRACPYILLLCMIILCGLLFIALIRYGHAFSTEANNYYYNL